MWRPRILFAPKTEQLSCSSTSSTIFVRKFSQDPEKLRLRLKICDFGFGLYYGESSSTDSEHSAVSERVVRTNDLSLPQLEHLSYGIRAPALGPDHKPDIEGLSQMADFARWEFEGTQSYDNYDQYQRMMQKAFDYNCGPRYVAKSERERLVQNVAPYGPFASFGIHPAVGEIIPPEVWHARIHADLGNRPKSLWPVRGLDVYAAAVRDPVFVRDSEHPGFITHIFLCP